MSDVSKPSIATSIALLNLKIDANQAETTAKLDGVTALVGEKLTNLEYKMDADRVHDDHRFQTLETRVNSHTDRITKLENDGNKTAGIRITVFGVVAAVFTALGAWFTENWHNIFK